MKFAVVLSGCGQHDGSETHETVLTLLSLSQHQMEWQALAPNINQSQVIHHGSNQPMPGENRRILTEAARLARGNIQDIATAKLDDYDGIVIPGGFGAVSNLCDWAEKDADFNIQADVKQFLDQAIKQKKPIGFICIAPMLITKLVHNATLTIGNDKAIAEKIQHLGCTHVDCAVDDIVVDHYHRLVTTPAYMLANNINEAYLGINKLVTQLISMAK